jgi:hypothetical protein
MIFSMFLVRECDRDIYGRMKVQDDDNWSQRKVYECMKRSIGSRRNEDSFSGRLLTATCTELRRPSSVC